MNSFFSRFGNFVPDPNSSLIINFERLAASQNWAPRGHARTREHRRFRNAMVEEFNTRYGTDDNNLESWQNLCRAVNIDPPPTSITQCRKVVRSTHVNLVDLIDTESNSGNVRVFTSLRQLREYTRETGKYFPKNTTKGGGILKSLLREMAVTTDE